VSLVLTPILIACAVLWIKFNPFSITSAFWIMTLSKAVNYALNGPTLKLLYIPTSKDTKYKAQSWIEMFGSRAAKGSASGVNLFRPTFIAKYGFSDGLMVFLTFTTIVSLGLVGVWVLTALFAAKTYNKAIKENTIVC
jgi:ATP:ADP antiporter, AAA family